MGIAYFLVGIGAGALAYYFYLRHHKRQQRRIPRQWPLKARPLLNTTERATLGWVHRVFPDHQIFVKLPVTRFTAPDNRNEATHWYTLLNGVYCSYTVCTPEGRAVGCVDVHNPAVLSLSNQSLKHGLLSQCGIRYWVVDPANLPHASQLRTAFLGEAAANLQAADPVDPRVRDQAESLQAAVTRQRVAHRERTLMTDFDPTELADEGPETQMPPSRVPSGWEHNSFVTPLDSRMAELT
ncbi:hypothetical protein RQP54_05765 [Curvibacter sp. APW13]|uniref:hypothetical protein n=1 Tax=Curvibacter sp. APW13 TaxID=3077236 RepID=UPI0028DD5D95|nr:hypothetical protein [Curvibacter sp. APW13]MDT8990368.1 hypothetical protein [Curvibacter sp. APW13]